MVHGGQDLRLPSSSLDTFSPFCAQPMSLTAIETPFLDNHPLLSSSAIFHISPRTVGARFAPPKALTATSPVRMPNFWVSKRVNIRLTRAASDGVGVKLVEDMVGVGRGEIASCPEPFAFTRLNGCLLAAPPPKITFLSELSLNATVTLRCL